MVLFFVLFEERSYYFVNTGTYCFHFAVIVTARNTFQRDIFAAFIIDCFHIKTLGNYSVMFLFFFVSDHNAIIWCSRTTWKNDINVSSLLPEERQAVAWLSAREKKSPMLISNVLEVLLQSFNVLVAVRTQHPSSLIRHRVPKRLKMLRIFAERNNNNDSK